MNIHRWRTTDSALGRLLLRVRTRLQLAKWLAGNATDENRCLAKRILQIKPQYTMVTNRNLATLYNLATTLNRENIPGDLVVCGVWNGGSSALMCRATKDYPAEQGYRAPWLFDSFQGLPPPGDKDDVTEKQKRQLEGLNHGSMDKVKEVFSLLDMPLQEDRVQTGWFEDTLPGNKVGEIALLHIDADWYDSVKLVLEHFYEKVVDGGYIVLDDYGYWKGCDKAWNDFCAERGLDLMLERIDVNGAYVRKPLSH